MVFLVLVLDIVFIWAIARLLAGYDVAEYKFHFAGLGCATSFLGYMLGSPWPPSVVLFIGFFLVVAAGLTFIVRTTWRVGLIGASLFLVYKLVLAWLRG